MIWMIQGAKLNGLDIMNNSALWQAYDSKCYEQLKILDDMNDFRMCS